MTQTAQDKKGAEYEFSYCAFSIKSVCERIDSSIPRHQLHILVDATFSIVPVNLPFKQILIITAKFFSQVFPFAFVLMSHKTETAYKAVFQYVNDNILSLDCASFTSDYETAMRNAFRLVCRNVPQGACHFHFAQAVKKNAYMHGLQSSLNSDAMALNLYQRLQCLPLLPASFIPETFEKLASESTQFTTHQNEWRSFITYYRRQWLEKEKAEKISVSGKSCRTTSAVEALNHRLSLSLPKRAGFFNFAKSLVKEATALSDEFRDAITTGGKEGSTKVNIEPRTV